MMVFIAILFYFAFLALRTVLAVFTNPFFAFMARPSV